MEKQFKNHVLESSFIEWYFSEEEMLESFTSMGIDALIKEGSFNISARILFDECGYIPQHICEDSSGDNVYEPSEVCFIQD